MKKTFVFLWIFGGVILFSWIYLPSLSKYHDLKVQQEELDKQIEKFSTDVTAIREERDLLKNDPEYLQKVIRDELGLVKPGEIVYKFVQDSPAESLEEILVQEPVPMAVPSLVPKSTGLTVEARPVPVKTNPPPRPAAVVPARPSTASNTEPVYPRRETR